MLAGASACTPAADKPGPATGPPAAPQAFVGTVRLLEVHTVLGIRNTDYVTLSFDGPRLRREVRPGGFADSTARYGIVADLRSDSLTYYAQDGGQNRHCRLARADYLARVAANNPVPALASPRPYSNIFAPLPAQGLAQEVKTGVALGKLGDCRLVVFFFPDKSRCEAIYSAQVPVPAPVLAYIEHNAPPALPSLALSVRYIQPPAPQGGNPVSRLLERVKRSEYSATEFSSLSTARPAGRDFALPVGSQYAGDANTLEDALEAASSSSHHHHHH